MQSLKVSLNLQLNNNQKHKSKQSVKIIKQFKKQLLNLQLNKVFGDMLTFYTFICKFGAGRYVDVCIERERESARECVTHTRSLSVQH